MKASFIILLCVLLKLLATCTTGQRMFGPILGICPGKTPPIARRGDSCGVPPFVDVSEFGDNKNTYGRMYIHPRKTGMGLDIRVYNLPKPDLVLTAWLIWVPGGVTTPSIFEVANHAAPCAPTNARFGSGLATDPNTLTYESQVRATLNVSLDFNPTYANEGPLTRETYNYQRMVPGIWRTKFRHFPTMDGVHIPTSSDYLRMYDRKTGFEMLDENGRPMVGRSPVKALGVEVIAHVDKTTHGIAQGVGGVDHYSIIFFPFKKAFGQRTRPMMDM